MPNTYSTPEFEAKYTYSGSDLGATWTEEKTSFRLWAPTATSARVNLYVTGDPDNDDLIQQVLLIPMGMVHPVVTHRDIPPASKDRNSKSVC
jgi:pullulanase